MFHRFGSAVAVLAAALATAACVPSGHLAREQAPAPTFDPIAFFAGHTEGGGELSVVFSGRKPTLVEGYGIVAPDGSIDLEQVVRVGGKAPTHRTWHLYRVAAGRYEGSLSDAQGPVAGDVTGNRLHLSFLVKGGLHMEQFLYLRPGGQVAQNRMVVSKLGIPVASLDETITRLPSGQTASIEEAKKELSLWGGCRDSFATCCEVAECRCKIGAEIRADA